MVVRVSAQRGEHRPAMDPAPTTLDGWADAVEFDKAIRDGYPHATTRA